MRDVQFKGNAHQMVLSRYDKCTEALFFPFRFAPFAFAPQTMYIYIYIHTHIYIYIFSNDIRGRYTVTRMQDFSGQKKETSKETKNVQKKKRLLRIEKKGMQRSPQCVIDRLYSKIIVLENKSEM